MTTTVTIPRLEPLPETRSFIDEKQRFEAERTLTNPEPRDIGDFLFLHNTVVALMGLTREINLVIEKINVILDQIDPPTVKP